MLLCLQDGSVYVVKWQIKPVASYTNTLLTRSLIKASALRQLAMMWLVLIFVRIVPIIVPHCFLYDSGRCSRHSSFQLTSLYFLAFVLILLV